MRNNNSSYDDYNYIIEWAKRSNPRKFRNIKNFYDFIFRDPVEEPNFYEPLKKSWNNLNDEDIINLENELSVIFKSKLDEFNKFYLND